MELNVNLVKKFTDTHTIIPIADGEIHNIFKLSPGLCHAERAEVYFDGEPLDPSQYKFILPSSEFSVRYGMDSVSALVLLDNSLRGMIEIKVCPIGGVFQNIDYTNLPATGKLMDYYGRSLEEVISISGLESFARTFSELPSRASDMDGILVGRARYPGSGDNTNIDELHDRVSLLETTLYHNDINIPVFNVPDKALFIASRNAPRVQLTTDTPNSTWYYEPLHSEIEININPVSGEIMWVSGIPEPGIYKVAIYIMSNGVRSDMEFVALNIS